MKRLVIGLIVLVGLLVGADFGAAALAESAVSRQMREQIGLDDDPEVRINGFPFLTQAISGTYSSIDVRAPRLQVGDLQDVEVAAELRDVDAPLSELLGSGPRSLRVGEVEGTVRVGPDDIERLIAGVEDLRIESVDAAVLERAVEAGGDPELDDIDPDTAARLAGRTTLLGPEMDVAVIVVLQLADDGVARIVPRDIRLGTGAQPIPEAQRDSVEEEFTVTVDPGSLPLQITPTTLRAVNGVLEVRGSTSGVMIGDGATTG